MTLLLSCQSASKAFTTRKLFQDLSISVHEGDKIGLIGLNGSGKSTLLKILAGIEKPDTGIISPKKGLSVGYLPQTCEFPDILPEQVLVAALKEDIPDYEKEWMAQAWLSKLGFVEQIDIIASKLSGGWKKRLGLAVQLISNPDLLLLDEPTNHLDLDGIVWLEKFLAKEAPTYILVSHDRYFLQNATNRIVEIDRTYPKGTFSIEGPYSEFLGKKEEFLSGQLQQERSIATKARRETDWLRQGAKARTVKSSSRTDAAHELLEQYADIRSRNTQNRTKISFSSTERETKRLLAGKNVAKSTENGRLLFHHLDFILSPGTRIGLMGPNGSGKTTLLKLLAGETEPDQGTIKQADNLKIVYFDQHRAQLPDELTLREALSPKGDFVTFQGQPMHVNGWCKRFLFTPDILDLPIGKLSGGERARIAIANLMLQPADLLLLDEPTNDLDIPTLETLEESLLDFPGAVILITHDRCMLDRTCNLFLALGNTEQVDLYPDYSQWEAASKKLGKQKLAAPRLEDKAIAEKKEEAVIEKKKVPLSYSEKKELDSFESKVAKLEEELKQLNHLMAQTQIATDKKKLDEVCKAAGIITTQIELHFLRWEELEKKQKGE
jgi:ATP-binding cassette subfamily F protein uup